MWNPWMPGWANPFAARPDPFAPWTRDVREFWTAEMQRQQGALAQAMAQEAARQAWHTWLNAWVVLPWRLMGLRPSGLC